MARARNIKPGFFTNDELVELPFEYRLLFVGLWTLADRDGRLNDRPKKIKMEIFPADNVDCDSGLQALHDGGFILRYEAESNRYIQIVSWAKHQNPHVKEAPSTIPAPDKHGASTVQTPCEAQPLPERAGLIPDSLNLIPDSLSSDSISAAGDDTDPENPKAEYPPAFEQAWAAYPDRPGKSKKQSHKAWAARIKSGVDPGVIFAGVQRYAIFCTRTEKNGTEYVKQPATFFGPDEHFIADWAVPATSRPTVNGASRHGNFANQDYRAGVGADGSF